MVKTQKKTDEKNSVTGKKTQWHGERSSPENRGQTPPGKNPKQEINIWTSKTRHKKETITSETA